MFLFRKPEKISKSYDEEKVATLSKIFFFVGVPPPLAQVMFLNGGIISGAHQINDINTDFNIHLEAPEMCPVITEQVIATQWHIYVIGNIFSNNSLLVRNEFRF